MSTTNQPDADLVSRAVELLWMHSGIRSGTHMTLCCDEWRPVRAHAEHVAHLLAVVLAPHIAEQRADAFDRGVSQADEAWKWAEREHMTGRDEIENPYRAAQHRSKP